MAFTEAYVPTVESTLVELVEGETISGGGDGPAPQNTSRANDRDASTASTLPAGFSAGTHYWRWTIDFGTPVTAIRARIWGPLGAGQYFYNPSGIMVRGSADLATYTEHTYDYTTASVDSGLSFPSPSTLTEHRYDLHSPAAHRYWEIRQYAPGGLNSGRGISELFLDGSTTVGSEVVWVAAADTVDGDDGTADDVDGAAITETTGPFWRGRMSPVEAVGSVAVVLGMESAGDVTVLLQGATLDDYSDAVTVAQFEYDATGSYTADELDVSFDEQGPYEFWRLVLDTAAQGVRVYEVGLEAPAEIVPIPASKAILELYIHDEDASRWGEATWATGPATGTEGIWSAAGWQDVTPEGVNAHVIWGSRRPSRGILAEQSPASWNVQTYDPDRLLDPGNFDSPYYPQLVAGVPIRISHDSLVIRTGYVDEFRYKHKRPAYQGQMIATDTWSLLNQAMVPADSILGNTLMERIQDAVNAAGIAVGGIPLPPSGPNGPTIADWEEGTPLDDPTSVGEHVRIATEEVLHVPFIQADAGLGIRPWGAPLDRGREITAENLEDLEAVSHEDGLYSVVKVQVEDPDADPIIRKATPLPRYGERVWERREPTVDPEGYAAAILSERPWPGVQYIPGAIHCFTAADVDYFGSIEIMERVTVTVAGAVSVQGRVLGGELFVEHFGNQEQGAKWIFNFAVATDGATAIGLTTLVADGTGETLLDDMTETDYLEAD